MKNLAFATVASLMIGSAYAMPTENSNGDHSYSFQGKPVSVRVASRSRNIPAPSSWTPPERIPSARVTIVHRDQPTKISGASFSSPSFSSPSFSSPSYSSPTYSSPSYSSPSFSSPAYSNPTYSSPSYSSPSYSSPSYSSPSYSSPSAR